MNPNATEAIEALMKGLVLPEKRFSIADLENLLKKDDEVSIEILPNGEVRSVNGSKSIKLLTMRENLGGEY